MTWLSAHWALLVSVLLGAAETLQLVFPSTDGFGGFLGTIVRLLKGASQPPALK